MPLSAAHRARMPKDWPEITARIRARDGNRCKFCGLHNGAKGYRDERGAFVRTDSLRAIEEAESAGRKLFKIVLTCAHLVDMDPAACDDANLAALCQKCHLNHDLAHHLANRRKTLAARKAIGDLFGAQP